MDRGQPEGWQDRFLAQLAQGAVTRQGESLDRGAITLQAEDLYLQGEWIGNARFEPLERADEVLSSWIAEGNRPFIGRPAGLFTWSHFMARDESDLIETLAHAAYGVGYRLDTHQLREHVVRRTLRLTDMTSRYGFEEGSALLEWTSGVYMDAVVVEVRQALAAKQIEVWAGFDPDADGNNPLRIYPPMQIAGEQIPSERTDNLLSSLKIDIWAFREKLGYPNDHFWTDADEFSCPSGLRYANQDVGDGVSGTCVAGGDDAGTDGSMAQATSCVALPHVCGAARTDDCCNSPLVTGGTFFRGYDVGGTGISPSPGDMSAPATVSSFRLDKYEVTVGRFRAFMAAGQGTQASAPSVGAGAHPKIPGSGWQAAWNTSLPANTADLVASLKCVKDSPGGPGTPPVISWTDSPGQNENRPINCLTWYEAMAFCAWDGGHLPTYAEWDYAAVGGDQQRAYPWSVPAGFLLIDGTHASYDCVGDGSTSGDCSSTDLILVGTKPDGDGRYGQADLVGNVDEWGLDTAGGPLPMPCSDCAYLGASIYHGVHGGDFGESAIEARTSYYYLDSQGDISSVRNGVRCARAP